MVSRRPSPTANTESDAFSLIPDKAPDDQPTFASPPCFMHELDPSYLGYLSRADVLTLLYKLLEGERAGAKGVAEMHKKATDPRTRTVLRAIAGDEAGCCAMLSRHIGLLGGTPTRRPGAFLGKLRALGTEKEKLMLLDRGQRWVVKTLRENLTKINDDVLYRDLNEMLLVHERNIEKCTTLTP